jgi:hypothetical protein
MVETIHAAALPGAAPAADEHRPRDHARRRFSRDVRRAAMAMDVFFVKICDFQGDLPAPF